jgi:dihydroorotase
MSRLVVRGARLLDPAAGVDAPRTLVADDGKVTAILPKGQPLPTAAPGTQVQVLEGEGLLLLPGLIDLHVHLREPGEERKETLRSGGFAAAAGGFTSLVAMPNTVPPVDTAIGVAWLSAQAARTCPVRLYPVGAVTIGQRGEILTDFGAMRRAGVVAFSDDGRPVMSAGLMRRALERALILGAPVAVHEEDLTLSQGGIAHEGLHAARLGLRGSPSQAEEVMVRRDLALCELTGARLHLCHLSTESSVRALREAKARGLPVTAEVTPHHLTLTEDALGDYDADRKMNPPLRTATDVEALRGALADGTIDVIATDHAPHAPADKQVEFDLAANGVVGLETALSVGLRLVAQGVLALSRLVEAFTAGPARVFGLPGGTLAVGAPADFTLVDLASPWTVDPERFLSKGRNTPFRGETLPGVVRYTAVGGTIVFPREAALG